MARLSHIALVITVNVLLLMCILAEEERYNDKYDNSNYLATLNNKTLREAYYNCFMKIAPCQTHQQTVITGMFSEAYQTNCKKCTEKQKEKIAAVQDWFQKNEPDKWQLIVAKTAEDMKKKATQ
ncbi:PREDICTED: ejaculatory bulb-specific protein 3-like [Cyphomyrmex costatus]|uniref:ejaculatory bulb-specific protein 3-like n=1 Tax=Cyphomyrmex costatus TaxID=456900 RepID=UPI000852335A|nr:PREDICTED: ejaculatory bulb-specific protein 3-like [Cyphomyrmex costatus]